jgi:branched-subunit amino acid aminotransferase/4-amino-4-deoxychorismate lyase
VSDWPVWVDGALLGAGSPAIRAEDLGLQLGLAVFETLLFERGCLYFLSEHLARLEAGARALDIAWPPPRDPRSAVREYAAALGGRDAALRPMLTRGAPGRGPTLAITARTIWRPPYPGVVLWISERSKHAAEQLEGVKSTSRVRNALAREEAQARGAYDALLLTDEGDVSEGTISNVWIVSGGRLRTPGLSRGCLAGVMRGRLLDDLRRDPPAYPVEEGRVELGDLAEASEVFVTNSTGRIVPAVAVLGLREGLPGAEGAIAADLRRRVERFEAAERVLAGQAGELIEPGAAPRNPRPPR